MNNKEPIRIRRSGINRSGVFATRDIKRGETICFMRGLKINAYLSNGGLRSGRNLILDAFQISEKSYIYFQKPYMLVNHSCNPNAGIRGGYLIAIKSIKNDNEITFDYSTHWFDSFMCNCKSKNCRGHIGHFFGTPKSIQRRYLRLGIIPDFIKKSLV